MLLIDLSSVVIPEIITLLTKDKVRLDDDVVRSVILSQVFNYKTKFSEYGKVVICADGKNYWRRDVFPNYKQNRKKIREKSNIDWASFYVIFNRVKKEIAELPFKFIEIEKLEADDVIAILAKRYSQLEDIMIISADKDLLQLQFDKNNIKQFSPQQKKMVCKNEKNYSLIEHIIRGDSSDGIPNIFSDDDVFMDDNKRQKQVRKTIIDEAKKMKNPEMVSYNSIILDKYKRNRLLIDLNYIPDEYGNKIVTAYEKQSGFKKTSILQYAIKHKLKNIIEKFGDFK